MLLNFRLKLQDFFKKHKNVIYILFICIVIIIAINTYLGKLKENELPPVTYDPHNPIISGDEIISSKTKTTIENTIDEYIKKCNSKEYSDAYNLISDECKEVKFNNDIELFKKYVDNIFDGNKIYSIQDYSNKDNIYIYQVSIFEDIMATGKNTDKSDEIYKEMIVLSKQDDNTMKLSINGFISRENIEYVAEDEYMKINLVEKITYYDSVIYKMSIKNKTNYTILLSRNNEKDCIGISLGGNLRGELLDNYNNNEKYIRGGNTREFEIKFKKYFDETAQESSINLNKVRILEKYTAIEENWNDEINDAIKTYSTSINLN